MARLTDVNTTDIRDAIRLGCRTMCSVFNADDNDIPFFGSSVRPAAELTFSAVNSEAHVPGRHLNALLNAEDAAGIVVDEDCIAKHADAAFLSYSGPLPLPLNRDGIGGRLVNFRPHHIREGFHALYALSRFRDSDRARRLAEASIAAIFANWDPTRGWDCENLEREMGLNVLSESTFIVGLARAIGPLVKYYRASGYAPALELAVALKEQAISFFFREDGSYDRERFGPHTHSTTCVMSSLAQLADLMQDSVLMGRIRVFYDNGLWEIRDALGWVIESSLPEAPSDLGEVNNTGDILETALILGRWGYAEYYHDAERILRGHLLPSQLRDISFIEEPPNPDNEDGKRDVAARHFGAFGFPAPYGHAPLGKELISFNMDIVGGAVGSLCEAYREITRFDRAGHWVNLLFDHETDAVKVESPYTHGALRIRVKRRGPLFVRVPPWTDPETITTAGLRGTRHFTNGYLLIAEPPVDEMLSFEFPLPQQEIVLVHRDREIRTLLRGDQVEAMENFGADLTFFEPFDQNERFKSGNTQRDGSNQR